MSLSGESSSGSGKHVIRVRKRKRISLRKDIIRALVYVLIPLSAGYAAGNGLAGLVNGSGAAGSFRDGAGLFMKHFAAVMSVPGRQPDDSFVFASFESPSDFHLWRPMSAHLEPADKHASHKDHSAVFSFEGNLKMAGMLMEEYFASRYGLTDWSPFQTLTVYIYNPQKKEERLAIKIKDREGNEYAQHVWMKPENGAIYRLDLDKASALVDTRRIAYLNIFSWEPDSPKTFYIDDVRLIPRQEKE